MDSKVSIIIPIYNVEKYIQRCINSAMNQTYENVEIILVNDGSPDQSPKICDQYSLRDKRIRVIHKENGGLSDARNFGLDVCTGEYIMFVDGDDYIESTLVEKAVEEIEKNQSDIVVWGYYADFVDLNENLISTTEYKGINGNYKNHNFKKIPLSNQLVGLLGYAWNKLYKSEIIYQQPHKFTKGLSLVEDIVFNGPILEACNSLTFIESPLTHYMQRPRETLGAKFYDDYFELKKKSVESVRDILLSWGKNEKEINGITQQMSFNALKSTVRLLSQANNYSDREKLLYLNDLLNDYTVEQLFTNIKLNSLKDNIIKYFMERKNVKLLLKIYSNNELGG